MWTYIVFCILIFLFGIAVGIIIDSAEINATYAQALDDAYNTGYMQGKKEAENLLQPIPAAYDVEKVVEDLQKASTIYEINEDGVKCAIEENLAVYIVRNGGIL